VTLGPEENSPGLKPAVCALFLICTRYTEKRMQPCMTNGRCQNLKLRLLVPKLMKMS